MEKHIPNKPKAIKDSIAQVAYDSAGAIIDPLLITAPQLGIPLKVLQATFGFRLAYKQEEINQFVEHLITHQDTFTKDLFSLKEFQDGLVIFMDDYFKMRGTEKLRIARDIFTDFSRSGNMPLYPIEAYDDTLMRISQEGLRFIGLLHNEILPMKDSFYLYEYGPSVGYSPEPQVSLSKLIDKYIENHPEQEDSIDILISEMRRLGVIEDTKTSRKFIMNSDTANSLDLSDYGSKFISIVKP